MADYIKAIRTNQGDKQIDYSALANLPAINNNLLINSDFRNPVNQREKTSYKGTGSRILYTIDRWGVVNVPTVTVQDNSLKIENPSGATYTGRFKQVFERALPSDFYTLSVKVKSNSHKVSITDFGHIEAGFTGVYSYTTALALELSSVEFFIAPGASIEIEWIKLEQGPVATPFVPRLYAEELVICQRYFRRVRRMPIFANSSNSVTYMLPLHFSPGMRTNQSTELIEVLNAGGTVQDDVTLTSSLVGLYNVQNIQLSKSVGQFGFITMTFNAEIY